MFALLYKRQPGNKMSSHRYRHCLTKNSRITTYKVFLSLQLTSNARLIHSAEISSPHSKLTWAMIDPIFPRPVYLDLYFGELPSFIFDHLFEILLDIDSQTEISVESFMRASLLSVDEGARRCCVARVATVTKPITCVVSN